MSAKVETGIWLALKNHIDITLPNYAKAWPSEVFESFYAGGELAPYLRVGRVSAAPIRAFIAEGKPHERRGFLVITLVYPLGQKLPVYEQAAAAIAEAFRDGTRVWFGDVCVTVPSYPHVQEGYEDNGYWTVPVRIPWRCFA